MGFTNSPIDSGLATATNEPTGFEDNANIQTTYDAANRTVTLTRAGGISFYLKRKKYTFPSPWTVPTVLGGTTPIAHANASGNYFLQINATTGAITFDTTPFDFANAMHVAFASQGATWQYCIRETHGLMQWQSHEENHNLNGTYIRTVVWPTAGTYAILTGPTATNAANTPGFDAATLYDEDLATVVPAWTEGTYTTVHRLGVGGGWVFSNVATVPFLFGGGVDATFIDFNQNSGGTWSLVDVPEDRFVNVLVLALPMSSSAQSQSYRYMCVLGQTTYTTLAAAIDATPVNWDLTGFPNIATESFPVMMLTYQKASAGPNATPGGVTGRCFLASEPIKFFGSARNLTGIGGIAPTDHQALSNRTATDSHPITAISPTAANKFIVSNAGATALAESTPTVAFTAGVTAITFAADASQTMASINNAQTFSAIQTFGNNIFVTGFTSTHVASSFRVAHSAGTSFLSSYGPNVSTLGAMDFHLRTSDNSTSVTWLTAVSTGAAFDATIPVTFNNVTASTSATTGCAIFKGGIGAAKDSYFVGLQTLENQASHSALFKGWSDIRGSAAISDGQIKFGALSTTGAIIQHYDGDDTITSFDNVFDSASSVMQFRMRTAGTPVKALSFTGAGAVTLGPANFSGTHTLNARTWIFAGDSGTPYAQFKVGSTAFGYFGLNGTDGLEIGGYGGVIFAVGSTTTGQYSSAGAWVLGPTTNTQVHDIRSPTQTTVGAAGVASALPTTPTGYLEIKIKGTTQVIPFYAKT